MNKTELVGVIAEKCNVTKKVAGELVEAFCDTIVETVVNGGTVQLVGFGTFTSVNKPARTGVNPRTKEPLAISGYVSPKFKVGKNFKDSCNKRIIITEKKFQPKKRKTYKTL